MQYIGVVHKDPDSDYGVSFPDLPGCVTAGKDLDEALRRAGEALAFHLQGMREDHERIPAPSSLAVVVAKIEDGGVPVIVAPSDSFHVKVKPANITLPVRDLQRIDKYAKEHGLTRSGFLLRAAKRAMEADLV